MNSTNYITPFWVQDNSGSSWTLYLYARNSDSNDGDLDWTIDVEYSTNLLTWNDFGTTPTTKDNSISRSFSANQRVYLRSKTQCTHWGKYDASTSKYWYIQILSNQQYSVGGNIMSLIYGPNFTGHEKVFPDDTLMGIFQGLFYSGGSNNNTYLIDADELVLPVTHSTSTIPSGGGSNDSPLNRVYRSMFERCTALIRGPHIDLRARGANDLAYCFQRIFVYCSSMKSVHCNTQSGNYRFNTMFANGGGASGGVFYDYSGGPASSEVPTARLEYRHIISMYLPTYDRVVDWHSSVSGRVYQVTDSQNKVIYLNEDAHPKYSEPFYVENTTNSTQTMYIRKSQNTALTLTIEYSTDKSTWNTLGTTSATPLTLSLQPHNKIYLRCNTDKWGAGVNIYNCIYGVSKVGGNIMSLLYGSNFNGEETTFPGTTTQNQFSMLFHDLRGSNSSVLTDASELLLPATELRYSCYEGMFYDCNSLTTAPALPATSLVYGCYSEMFTYCSSLTKAPDLNAYVLAQYCYGHMFQGCTSLNEIKCLAMDTSAIQCTLYWLSGVSSTGTFTKARGATWQTGTDGIPEDWAVVEV